MLCRAILKNLKIDIAFTDFGEIWHGHASRFSGRCQPLRFPEFKNPRWPPETILKSGNIAISPHPLDQFR